MRYSFDNVIASVDELALGVPTDEPITVDFIYSDSDGIKWTVHAEGTRRKVEGTDNANR